MDIGSPHNSKAAMDVEAPHNPNAAEPTRVAGSLRRVLVVFNVALLFVGGCGAPLVSRVYFIHGGHRKWLSSWLETGAWPIIFIPLIISYFHRRRQVGGTDTAKTKAVFITPRLFIACAVLGVLTGVDDFIYAYGLAFLPISTSSILISTQLVFTALFAFLIVRQKFTPYSINAVALLTVGAVILGLHGGTDRPAGVSKSQYFLGFIMTLAAALLYGLVLPLIELTYAKAKQRITYTLVMEMQLVIALFATGFCTIGMLVNKDFEVIPREASNFGLGEVKYYTVLVWNSILWQFFFLGSVGVIFCVHTLLAGIIIAACIPVNDVLGVVFLKEKFSSDKGVSLVLSLWGLASYSYGEYRAAKEKKAAAALAAQARAPPAT